MKRNASLVLVELLIMLAVFAVAAALCIDAFVWADGNSKESAAEDQALLQAQNAAEVLKHCHGDFSQAAQALAGEADEKIWQIFYDNDWNVTTGDPAYVLKVAQISCETAYLGQAKLTVTDRKGAILAELSLGWQEVTP